jgi:PAS domain S-box-containing protein
MMMIAGMMIAGTPVAGGSLADRLAGDGVVAAPANVPTFGFDWDLRADVIRREAAAARLLGAGALVEPGAAFLNRVHPADRDALRAAIASTTPAASTYRVRYRLALKPDGELALKPDGDLALKPDGDLALKPDGELALKPDGELALAPDGERVIEDHGRARFDAAGVRVGASVVSADITDHVLAGADAARQHDLLAEVMDRLPAMVMVYDTAFAGLRVNRSMTGILGWSQTDLAEAADPLALWWPLSAERARAREVLLRAGGRWTDLPMTDCDGIRVDIAWASAGLLDGRRVAVGIDVREQRRTERRLAEMEQRFRTMAETVPDILFIADPKARAEYLNERFYSVTGMAPGSGLGHGWMAALHPDDCGTVCAAWDAALAAAAPLRIRYRLHCADGAYRWWETRARPMAVPSADPAAGPAWFGAASDVDELVRAQQALTEADRQKDDFLAILGHELRNPMAPLQNAVDLMGLLRPDDAKLRWSIDVVERQVRQMDRLLDDLLDVSRIVRGKLRLERRVVALNRIIEQAIDAAQPALEARGHRFDIELPEAPVWLDADPARLAQVLTNLLNNAAKYTPDGGHVRLSAATGPGTLVLRVADNGDGIDAELRASLFQIFTQGRHRLERTGGGRSGLGLGLAIAARLAELHGGRIEVESAGPGQGSTFSVYLPTVAAPPAEPTGRRWAPGPTSRALRVLVVDDSADAADGMAMLLSALGHEVRVCRSGAEALAAAPRFRPRIVLLDLGMDGMDGFETARRLRALEGTGWRDDASAAVAASSQDRANTGFAVVTRGEGPVESQDTRQVAPDSAGSAVDTAAAAVPMLLVAVSGYGDARVRERGRAVGFDRHFTKPVGRHALMELLAEAARGAGPKEDASGR